MIDVSPALILLLAAQEVFSEHPRPRLFPLASRESGFGLLTCKPHKERSSARRQMLIVDISAKSPFEGDPACVSGDVSSPVSLLAVQRSDVSERSGLFLAQLPI